MGRCPVFTIIQQCHPEAVLGEIQPLVSPHLQEVPRDIFTAQSCCLGAKAAPATGGAAQPWDQTTLPLTSNRAQSQDVFQCVGRWRCPNWIS